jgi:hypothetical protein
MAVNTSKKKVPALKQIVIIVCIALTAMVTSYAFGAVILITVTPKYVAERSKEFKVETEMQKECIQFKITRFVREERHYSGELVVRKGGRDVVLCQVLPSEGKSCVTFTFLISPDYLDESDFFLSENRWIEVDFTEPGTGRKTMTKQLVGDIRFSFPLREFAKSVDNPH